LLFIIAYAVKLCNVWYLCTNQHANTFLTFILSTGQYLEVNLILLYYLFYIPITDQSCYTCLKNWPLSAFCPSLQQTCPFWSCENILLN